MNSISSKSEQLSQSTIRLRSAEARLIDTIKSFNVSDELAEAHLLSRTELSSLLDRVVKCGINISTDIALIEKLADTANTELSSLKAAMSFDTPDATEREIKAARELIVESQALVQKSIAFCSYAERAVKVIGMITEDISSYDFVNPHHLKSDLQHDWNFYVYQVKRIKRV